MDESVRAEIMAPSMNQTVTLADHTSLSYSEVGNPQGRPVVCFLGLGGSRLTSLIYKESALGHNLRLITVDRPGVGPSTPCPPEDLSLKAFAGRVLELLDLLRIGMFSILGQSCGCLFAAALAVCAPSRVLGRLALVSPWSVPSFPPTGFKIKVAHQLPGWATSFFGSVVPYSAALSARSGMQGFWGWQMKQSFTDKELEYVMLPRSQELMKQTTEGAVAEGWKKAFLNDILLCLETYRQCDIQYTDVTTAVVVYHGDLDDMVPLTVAVWMQENMHSCELVIKSGGMHSILWDIGFMESVVFASMSREWRQLATHVSEG